MVGVSVGPCFGGLVIGSACLPWGNLRPAFAGLRFADSARWGEGWWFGLSAFQSFEFRRRKALLNGNLPGGGWQGVGKLTDRPLQGAVRAGEEFARVDSIGTSIFAPEKASQTITQPTPTQTLPEKKLQWRRCAIPKRIAASPMEGTRKIAMITKA